MRPKGGSGEPGPTTAPRRARVVVPLILLALVAVALSRTDAMAHLAAVLWIASGVLMLIGAVVATRGTSLRR
ncbi:hypothetical protein [Cellulomonas chengniuliangii]|uniref:Uncharacterized protein n=1 Tax=Cellulomonas chengniuliangii TaxID=2968084 RepID=A0ABY5KZC1_9CELL|nr:hypothetical protein [Cellulomonas chengniuliangii]MCC2307731.1 hypothetical protein [Cellulomonas chengniuliangii]UUI75509.1 hypothetical protein NP064_00845 [Cellulomonas chengniuliangii]